MYIHCRRKEKGVIRVKPVLMKRNWIVISHVHFQEGPRFFLKSQIRSNLSGHEEKVKEKIKLAGLQSEELRVKHQTHATHHQVKNYSASVNSVIFHVFIVKPLREHQSEKRRGKLEFVFDLDELRTETREGDRRNHNKKTVLQWESALLSAAPCWGLGRIGDHEEDCTSQNQIPLEHSTALSQHIVTAHNTTQHIICTPTLWPSRLRMRSLSPKFIS